MNSKDDKQPKKSFKIVLNTGDAFFTGQRMNAVWPIDFRNLPLSLDDLKKSYKMTFSFRSTADTGFSILNSTSYLISIFLNNGSSQRNALTYLKNPTGILNIANDNTNTYTRNINTTITATTGPNQITVGSNTGLIVGQSITVYGAQYQGGADFGGLVSNQTYVITAIAGTTITLANCPTLTTLTGNMGLVASYNFNYPYFDTKVLDNPPTFINNLLGITQVNIFISNMVFVQYSNTPSYVCILNFEEI